LGNRTKIRDRVRQSSGRDYFASCTKAQIPLAATTATYSSAIEPKIKSNLKKTVFFDFKKLLLEFDWKVD
jgi:hypothetical protein